MNQEITQMTGAFSGKNVFSAGLLFLSFFKNINYFIQLIKALPDELAITNEREYTEAELLVISQNHQQIVDTMILLRPELIGFLLKKNLKHGIDHLESLIKKYGNRNRLFSNQEWEEDRLEMVSILNTLGNQKVDPTLKIQYLIMFLTLILGSVFVPLIKSENRREAGTFINYITTTVSSAFNKSDDMKVITHKAVYYSFQGIAKVNDSVDRQLRITIGETICFPDTHGNFKIRLKTDQKNNTATILRFSIRGLDTSIRLANLKSGKFVLNWTLKGPVTKINQTVGNQVVAVSPTVTPISNIRKYPKPTTNRIAAVALALPRVKPGINTANAEIKDFWIEDNIIEDGKDGFRVHCKFNYSNIANPKLIFEATILVRNSDSTEYSTNNSELWLQTDSVSGNYSDLTLFIARKDIYLKKGTNNLTLQINLFQDFDSSEGFDDDNGKNKGLIARSLKKDIQYPLQDEKKAASLGSK